MNNSATTSTLSLRQHAVYCCSQFLAYALPLLFFLVTTSFYLKTYDSAQIKITFTQIGTTVIAAVWFAKILLQGRFPFQKRDLIYIAPFIAFLLSGVVSYFHSHFKVWATEETLRRVFYMAIAIISISEMRSEEHMRRLWRWLLAAAWTCIGYGVLQYLDSRLFMGNPNGLDPFIWRQAFAWRVFSTFGNPNFYGNFLVILTPLIFASILRGKGSLIRPFVVLLITLGIVFLTDKMMLKMFGGFDPSYSVVVSALILFLLVGFLWACFSQSGTSGTLPMLLVLFACLFLNLYSTETKGAWLGFTAAVAVTLWLIVEYFFHLDEVIIEAKKYGIAVVTLLGLFAVALGLMFVAFVLPLFQGNITQIGFSILWIPTLVAAILAIGVSIWILKRPWNLRKLVYGFLVFFVISMGGLVLQYAKTRLLSVSFRLFTWISTWEMIRTEPLLGNGVGTFKVIYPAFRRPQIITLEGKSNTETDHSEDEYIEVWQDEGIIGFGIFLWMIITALSCGFKQLSWFSKIRGPTTQKRSAFSIENDPRSYEVLGILGAYMGALIHWTVDVSVRFVSSGVFSGLLPGLLVTYARNHDNPVKNEPHLSYDRWIRVFVAGMWTAVFLYLRLELIPASMIESGDTTNGQIVFFCILAGLFIFGLLELLEMGLMPDRKNIPMPQESPSPVPLGVRLAGLVLLGFVAFRVVNVFSNHFQADVHHNLAIFFSKNAIWTKSPRFDEQLMKFPEDIREQYRNVGGALDHYAAVIKNNPAFPMAIYFTGNVYNDWGSQQLQEALNARSRGDVSEALRLKDRALEMWDKSEKSYEDLKKIAPNYVQTHHQVGLLFVKKAELYNQFGETQKAAESYQIALKNFRLYHHLDPVFPPNYDRMVQILLIDKKFDEAIELYKKAIYYNDVVAKSINVTGYPDRVAELSTSLGKLYFTQAQQLAPDPFHPRLPQIDEAMASLKKAVESNPRMLEAWKALGFLQQKAGLAAESQESLRRAIEISPNDPELTRG